MISEFENRFAIKQLITWSEGILSHTVDRQAGGERKLIFFLENINYCLIKGLFKYTQFLVNKWLQEDLSGSLSPAPGATSIFISLVGTHPWKEEPRVTNQVHGR